MGCAGSRPRGFAAGERIAELVALWCPEQTHEETAAECLVLHGTDGSLFATEADGYLLACNFGDGVADLPLPFRLPTDKPLRISPGLAVSAAHPATVVLHLSPHDPAIAEKG